MINYNEIKNKKFNNLIDLIYILTILLTLYILTKFLWEIVYPVLISVIFAGGIRYIIKKINGFIKINIKISSFIITTLIFILILSAAIFALLMTFQIIRNFCIHIPDFTIKTIIPFLEYIFNYLSNLFLNLPDYEMILLETQNYSKDLILKLILSISEKGLNSIAIWKLSDNLFQFITIAILTFIMALSYDEILGTLYNSIPLKYKDYLFTIKDIFKNSVLKYLEAALILSLVTFTISSLGLLIIGADNIFIFAVIISILDFLPIVGAGTFFIPYIFIETVSLNYRYAIGLAVLYIIILLIKNIIEPKIVGEKLGLHPALSIISIYVGFKLFGFIGTIIAPIIMIIFIEFVKINSIDFSKNHKNQMVSPD